MWGWFIRLWLVAAGVMAGWFVAPEANNFELFRFVCALFLLVAFAALAAFWPSISAFYNRFRRGENT